MALEVGVNSYITVEQADQYIASRYRASNAARQRWEGLKEEDKEVLLLEACSQIEQLPFQGKAAVIGQALAWPRLPFCYGLPTEPPQAVLDAQAELALWLSDDEHQAELAKRRELQEQGVASFSLGDLSESYKPEQAPADWAMRCLRVRALLQRYINGGVKTC